MPATVKLKEEYGSDLAVILVECQGADEAKFMKFAAGHKWLGREMMWTRERPFMTGAKGLPNYALLDETGTIVAMGNPMRDHGKITSEIDAAIARSKKGPKGLPKEAAKLERAFYEEGPDEKLSQRIGNMASKHEGTRVAIRAAVLAEWAAE